MTASPPVILTPAERVASPLVRQPITWRTPAECKRMAEAFAEFEKIYRKHQAAGMRGDGSAGRT